MSGSTATLKRELALWRRRHEFRLKRLALAHYHNDSKRIKHWHALVAQAGAHIHEIEHELARRVSPVDRVCAVAEHAAANYRANPGAYHYLAGGIPTTVILKPTPRNYRSDCSQFAVNLFREAGLPCPGSGTFLYSNTVSIANGRGKLSYHGEPGMLGLYGSRYAPHHVEFVAKGHLIGHGTQPIDSTTPGQPDFYLSFI